MELINLYKDDVTRKVQGTGIWVTKVIPNKNIYINKISCEITPYLSSPRIGFIIKDSNLNNLFYTDPVFSKTTVDISEKILLKRDNIYYIGVDCRISDAGAYLHFKEGLLNETLINNISNLQIETGYMIENNILIKDLQKFTLILTIGINAAPPSGNIKINNQLKEISNSYIKINKEIKEINEIWVKKDNSLKEIY